MWSVFVLLCVCVIQVLLCICDDTQCLVLQDA